MKFSNQTIRIGIPAYWGTTIPPLQHSAYGVAVIDNIFEPLVRRGKSGLIEPLGAKSWERSADFKKLKFTINTSRRFSDGSYLTAYDFKRSWEEGLKMESKSSNLSILDVLCDVKGFNSFKEKGTLSGVHVLSENLLEIEFEKPVRTALEYLGGVRYAAYKLIDGKAIGTGPYAARESAQSIKFNPNLYYQGEELLFKEVEIVITPSETMMASLESGEIDSSLFAELGRIETCDEKQNTNINCTFGQEGAHIVIHVNGLAKRLFSNEKYRLALQALVHKQLISQGLPQEFKDNHYIYDPQSFLPFQPGRLAEIRVNELVSRGEEHIPDLIKASHKTPVHLTYLRDCQWLITLLEKTGLQISQDSGKVESAKFWEIIYKTHVSDIVFARFSVYNSDPDGLYHKLGKSGAIFSSMEERKNVASLIASGREIIDQSQLAAHYEKVNTAILEEVPYVHLGFDHKAVAYNKNKIKISDSFINRNNYRITIFEPK